MLLLGNSEGAVRSGPAADWPVHPAECRREGRTLTRQMRRNAARRYFRHREVLPAVHRGTLSDSQTHTEVLLVSQWHTDVHSETQ